MKLSEQLKQDHECGDFGLALDGYQERAESLEQENAALKAQVNALRGAIVLTKGAYKISQFDEALRVSELTPEQCLADVKAAERKAGWLDGFTCTTRDYNGEYFSYAGCLDLAEQHAEKIRRGE